MGIRRWLSGTLRPDKVETDSLSTNHLFTVPPAQGISGIQTGVDNLSVVRLKPGETYSGSSTLQIDVSDGRSVFVDARGATIDSSADVVVDLPTNWESAEPWDGRVTWVGGDVGGPGRSTTGSIGFRATDHAYATIKPERVYNVDIATQLRNVDRWTEFTTIDISATKKNADASTEPNEVLSLKGASETGGSGTESFRGTDARIYCHFQETAAHFTGTKPYASRFWIEGFGSDAGSTGWLFDGDLIDLERSVLVSNMEETGTEVNIQTTMGNPPDFARLNNPTDVTTSGNQDFPVIHSNEFYDAGERIARWTKFRFKFFRPIETRDNLYIFNDKQIRFEDENGDTIKIAVDNGELKAIDSAGNSTTLT